MLNLEKLESIIENLEKSRENTKAILDGPGTTILHTKDYYEGQFSVYDDVVKMLKMHKEVLLKQFEKIIEDKIEELEKLIDEIKEDEQHSQEIPIYQHDIQTLQDLLKGGNGNENG